jgi:hypothetical protein
MENCFEGDQFNSIAAFTCRVRGAFVLSFSIESFGTRSGTDRRTTSASQKAFQSGQGNWLHERRVCSTPGTATNSQHGRSSSTRRACAPERISLSITPPKSGTIRAGALATKQVAVVRHVARAAECTPAPSSIIHRPLTEESCLLVIGWRILTN